MESGSFSRAREIIDATGLRLQVALQSSPGGAVIRLHRPDVEGEPLVLLDAYGAELLSGYLMAARLAVPGALPAEEIAGSGGVRLQLVSEPVTRIDILCAGQAVLAIPAGMWDRLFAELCIIGAHARAWARPETGLLLVQ
ncbi:MAG: hypothetical protein ACTHMG_11180 [Sphingomonas sp.]